MPSHASHGYVAMYVLYVNYCEQMRFEQANAGNSFVFGPPWGAYSAPQTPGWIKGAYF